MTTQRSTICIADIGRFNVATRNMSLDDVVAFVQGFYEFVGNVLLSHNGRLVKYVGDSVMMHFSENHEEAALRAMWRLNETFDDYLQECVEDASVAVFCASIATGEIVAGQMGHPEMLAYDVIGRPVIVAQALLRHRGVTMDGNTYEELTDRVQVEPVTTPDAIGYRVLGLQ